jgi:site-specific DNA recombinase
VRVNSSDEPDGSRLVRVAIYARISRDDGGEALGVQRQLDDCRARVSREPGWVTVATFVDNDVSASESAGRLRPQWTELLAAAERMEFDVVLGYSSSRFSRAVAEREQLISINRHTGVRFCTILDGDDNFDTSDGRMVSRIRGAVDAAYSERISENVKRAARQRSETGRPHGGRRPFGWGVEIGTYTRKGEERPIYDTSLPREPEFTALREAIYDVTEGKSLRAVAKEWDAAGLAPTGQAETWIANLTSVRNVLVRWRNAGYRTYAGQPLFDAPLACTPVVTREELEALRDHLSDRSRRKNKGRVALSALLGGLALCGVCTGTLRSASHEVSKRNPTKVSTYRCVRGHVTIRRAQLDEVVVGAVLVELMSSDLTLLADSDADRDYLRQLRNELEELEAESVQLAVDRGNGTITRQQFHAANSALQTRVEKTERAWQEVQSRFALADWVRRERQLLELADDERDTATEAELLRFEALPLHRRREIIFKLLTVTVYSGRTPDRVTITANASGLMVPPDRPGDVTFGGPPPPSPGE